MLAILLALASAAGYGGSDYAGGACPTPCSSIWRPDVLSLRPQSEGASL